MYYEGIEYPLKKIYQIEQSYKKDEYYGWLL